MLSKGLVKTKDHATQGGGFADVWEGTYNGSQVAIKVLRVYETDDFDRVRKVCLPFITVLCIFSENAVPAPL